MPLPKHMFLPFRFMPGLFLAIGVLILASGCAPYKMSPREAAALQTSSVGSCASNPNKEAAIDHPLYNIIPRHRCQVRWYDAGHWASWMLFGNDDDGIFGEGPAAHYREEERPGLAKALAWGCRNPLHNFCFYVIGSAERCNSEIDLLKITPDAITGFAYRPEGHTVFAHENSSLYLGLHGGKPFLSMRLAYSGRYKADFYFGWRERGNFGIKFLPFSKRKFHAGSSMENSVPCFSRVLTSMRP